MIEDKIDAVAMPEQASRYYIRGQKAIERRDYDEFYHAAYTCLSAGRMDEEKNMKCSVVGCCCESGNIIQEDVMMPESTCRGDIIAVCTTGAYNYSMASNYNRHTRPPVIMLKNGCENFPVVRRETFEDLCRNDL